MITLDALVEAWRGFWFYQESAVPIAVFRIAFGTFLLAEALLTAVDLELIYGRNGLLPYNTWVQLRDSQGFRWQPRDPVHRVVAGFAEHYRFFFYVHVAAAVALTVGAATFFSTLVCFFTLRVVQERNRFAVGGYEATYRLLLFLLMLAPAGAALSADRWLLYGDLGWDISVNAWSVQLLRLQICWIIFDTALHKVHGRGWVSGDAVFRLMELGRQRPDLAWHLTGISLPSSLRWPPVYRAMTWTTLAVQLVCPVTVWIEQLRVPSLVLLVLHHAMIQIFTNVSLYQVLVVIGLCLFVRWG